MSLKRLLMSSALAAVMLATGPAHASVNVVLDVNRGYPPVAAPIAHCTVSVPGGGSGVAVLNAAVASGCIASYTTIATQYGTYLQCINGECETGGGLITYWRMSVGGRATCYGMDDFEAAAGKQLAFTHTPTATLAADILLGCAP